MQRTKHDLLSVLKSVGQLIAGRFDSDAGFVNFRGGRNGGLNRVGFPPGLRFILLLVVLEVGSEGRVGPAKL